MADSGGAELDAFRAEARDWLEANFPAVAARRSRRGGRARHDGRRASPRGDLALWKQRMAEKGWGTPTWPKKYGGGRALAGRRRGCCSRRWTGSGPTTRSVGMGAVDVRPDPAGVRHRGAEAAPHPADRAGARCAGARAIPSPAPDRTWPVSADQVRGRGDHWMINGQKIWTSGAQYADWCFCLVRTDTTKKHEGISFVLINMHQPGVETRPIKLIAGSSPFCETFFTDARAEKDDMVGPLNGGWTVGKRLLQHERSGQGGARGWAAAAIARRAGQEVRRRGRHRAGSPTATCAARRRATRWTPRRTR